MVEAAIERFQPEVVTIVQGETSNTVHNYTLPTISEIARKHNAYIVVDAVCTLSTMPLKMDEWGIDAVITGGQRVKFHFLAYLSWHFQSAPGNAS